MTLHFSSLVSQIAFEVEVGRVIIAGFTGRSKAAVAKHIAELELAGVPAPEQIPAVYEVEPTLLMNKGEIDVQGRNTSGEVEPVLIKHGGGWLLCVGSDHTDRDLERIDIAQAKRACPKVIGTDCLRISGPDWDQSYLDRIELRSWINGRQPYQEGRLSDLLPVATILHVVAASVGAIRDGDVMFLGTVALNDGRLIAADRFRAELRIPGIPTALDLEYSIRTGAVK